LKVLKNDELKRSGMKILWVTLLCKTFIVARSKEGKTGCNLAESSKEGYGSKGALLPMVMI
jgi:hypothetical protein